MSKSSNDVLCFLDLEMGDQVAYEAAKAAYARGEAFLLECGKSYGINAENLVDCTPEQQEMLKDLYDSNPKYNDGEMSTVPPKSLSLGRIVIKLFVKKCPKTCENFRALCTGEKGVSRSTKAPLHYKGTVFHRYVPNVCLQGGDFTRHDGSGGESIYGKTFKDEKPGLKLKHDKFGLVSMANSGTNSNNSQFFFTLGVLPKLDKRHVIFGECVEGVDILERINNTVELEQQLANGTTIRIVDCGQL